MKFFLFLLLSFLCTMSCSKSFYPNSNTPNEGKYFNKKDGIFYGYAKIENNIAYIDVMRFTKGPEYYFSDTLVLNNGEEIRWNGELVALFKKNRKLILEAPTIDFYGNIDKLKTISITLKQNEKFYDTTYNHYKNQALFYGAYRLLDRSDANSGKIFRDLSSKYQMNSKRLEMEHHDFLIEFKRFEEALIEVLEKQNM